MSQATILPPPKLAEPAGGLDSRYEIINGRIVEKPPMGNIQVWVATILVGKLTAYVWAHGLGRVFSEALFKINPVGNTKRAPDVSFVTYERLSRDYKITPENGFDVAPDLAIEVISPTNAAEEVVDKIGEYFRAEVRQVWIVYPSHRLVYAYDSPRKVVILGEGDEVEGGEILPGFRLPLAELFEDGAER